MKRRIGRSAICHVPAGALLVGVMALAVNLNAAVPTQFDFGTGTAAAGYTKVTPATAFSTALGYGFQPSTSAITAVSRGGTDLLRGDYCTSVDSFSFSLALPLGNYTATVYLGDLNGTSTTSVYGEQRRLFLDRISTASGQIVAKTFTINRRDYKNGTVTISRTTREDTYADFDNVLNFTFAGSKMAVCGIDVVSADPSVITVFICGNSTSVDQPAEPFCSWPQMITRMFNSKVAIADYAESGLTASSFLGQHRLDMIGTVIKAGDYVLAEFGHNDQKNATDVANYCSNLTQYSTFATSHNATPIFVTPTARKTENDSTTSVGGMAQKARDCAGTDKVKVIELNAGVIALHKSLGTANVSALYATSSEDTHFSDYGSFELARVVAKEIVRLNLNIAQDLTTDLPLFDPSKPDALNYLTTPTVGTGIVRPFEVKKTISDEAGLSIALPAHTIQFTPGKTGKTVFAIYSPSGKRIAEKMTVLAQTQGSVSWPEIAGLPQGVYLLKMKIENNPDEKMLFCKM
jgi:lysophospholipase L1-like esterase